MWYNTNAGGLFVYYQDANSSQWVEVVGKTGATGATGAQGPAGSSAAITRYANVAGFPEVLLPIWQQMIQIRYIYTMAHRGR